MKGFGQTVSSERLQARRFFYPAVSASLGDRSWLSACSIHGSGPALLGIVDTGIRHQEVLRLFDLHRVIIDQHVDGLPPKALIYINSKLVQPNLAALPHLTGQLAEKVTGAITPVGD